MNRGIGRKMRGLFAACALLLLSVFLPAANAADEAPFPEFDVAQMRRLNPDFTTFPETHGIVWLRQSTFARAKDGGMERKNLWVILGRSGLDERWRTWNIPTPEGGRADILEAAVYSFETGAKIRDVTPAADPDRGITALRFEDLPETFVLAVAWRDVAPKELSFEGLVWIQESLPVWESIVEVSVPPAQQMAFRSFPGNLEPVVERGPQETLYTWRVVNASPFSQRGLVRGRRSGLAFSVRRGETGMVSLMRDAVGGQLPPPPAAALEGFGKSREEGTRRLLSWLYQEPVLTLPEGALRAIPAEGPWTRREKLILAGEWLKKQGVDAAMMWRLPIEPAEEPPLSAGLLEDALLEIPVFRGNTRTSSIFFCDMRSVPSLGNTSSSLQESRVFGLSGEGRVKSRKIPGTKAAENRLSAVMKLKLNEQGMLSGPVRVILRGAWVSLLLPSAQPDEAELNAALLTLFPDLQNYGEVRYRRVKEGAEVSFTLNGKPGVAGSGGQNLLALPPAFVPKFFNELGDGSDSVELKFPFILEQSMTIALPRSVDRVLLEGETKRGPDKVNYSDSCKSRRHRLEATARFEVGTAALTGNDLGLLQRCSGLWQNFSRKHLPVQMKR